jgi:hypothetical protein
MSEKDIFSDDKFWQRMRTAILLTAAFGFEVVFFAVSAAMISALGDEPTASSNSAANANRSNSNSYARQTTNRPASNTVSNSYNTSTSSSSSSSRSGRTGTLTIDVNLREYASKDATKVGTHYRGARIRVLETAEVPNDEGSTSTWYRIEVLSYGTSMDPNNSGLDKDPGSEDEGWINSYPKIWDASSRTSYNKSTVSLD